MRLVWLAVFLVLSSRHATAVCTVETYKASQIMGVACFETGRKCVPIPHALIELITTKGQVVYTGNATSEGEFRFRVEGGPRLRMRVSAPGFVRIECEIIKRGSVKSQTQLTAVLGSDTILPCGGGRVMQGQWKAPSEP